MNGILSLQGRHEEQEALVRDISSRYPGLGGWQSVLGCVEARRGMRRQARQRFERLMAGLGAAIRVEPFVLGLLGPLADLCSEIGDVDHAARLYRALAPYARYYGIIVSAIATQGPVARHMGLLAARMGRHELAAAHFEAALATTDGGSRPHLALACHEYARMLASTDNASSRTRAHELLERALSEGHALDMAGLVRDCQALAADLAARSSGVARAHVRRVLP
jgi:tetratricopeptide (TPR) repeat protein